MRLFRDPNQNFPPIGLLPNFPRIYVCIYFRGKNSFQMSKFPWNQVPEFSVFSRHDLMIISINLWDAVVCGAI